MLFVVRGKSASHQERCIRVEAESAEQAETIGFARGVFVTEVLPVDRQTPTVRAFKGFLQLLPSSPLRCFGRPVSNGQSAALLALGAVTWIVDLHALNLI